VANVEDRFFLDCTDFLLLFGASCTIVICKQQTFPF
jgi:hypothetical protein